jgi:hypothetical protein
MDPRHRIVNEFDRLVALGRERIANQSIADRAVYYIVATRCEIDIDGFAAVYEQDLNPTELATLVAGLNEIGESEVAEAFDRGYRLLKQEGFYDHMNWHKVPDNTKSQIELISKEVGDRLWDLDDKMVALLDGSNK